MLSGAPRGLHLTTLRAQPEPSRESDAHPSTQLTNKSVPTSQMPAANPFPTLTTKLPPGVARFLGGGFSPTGNHRSGE